MMKFRVVNKKTGKEPIYDFNHMFKEKWFKESNLIWCDLSDFAITEDGHLILTDDCDNMAYVPMDKYMVVFDQDKHQDKDAEDIIKVIKTERECVIRNKNECNRDCANCDLVLPDEDIIKAYDYCLKLLNEITLNS